MSDLLSDAEVASVQVRMATVWGVRPDEVIVVPYGRFCPVPVVPLGDSDGTGRWPRSLRAEQAGLPWWFLDRDIRQRKQLASGAMEPNNVYAVRLCLELLDAQFLTGAPDWRVRSVFPQLSSSDANRSSLNVMECLDDRERVKRVVQGGFDADLCTFSIPRREGSTLNALEEALRVCGPWEVHLARLSSEGRSGLWMDLRSDVALLRGLDLKLYAGRVVSLVSDSMSEEQLRDLSSRVTEFGRVVRASWEKLAAGTGKTFALRNVEVKPLDLIAQQQTLADQASKYADDVDKQLRGLLATVFASNDSVTSDDFASALHSIVQVFDVRLASLEKSVANIGEVVEQQRQVAVSSAAVSSVPGSAEFVDFWS